MSDNNCSSLEKLLGHVFSNQALFKQSLTHRSFASTHNERLEFLGDSVLNCVVSDLLYQEHPDLDEGKLSRVRSHLVRQDCLVLIANQIGLNRFLILGAGESRNTEWVKDSIIADALEALLGAIFLDAGFDVVRHCIFRLWKPVLSATPLTSMGKDPKTKLQELLQFRKMPLPVYRVLVEGGSVASPEFQVQCVVESLNQTQLGRGASRRIAEQQGAQAVLDQLMHEEASSATRRSGDI